MVHGRDDIHLLTPRGDKGAVEAAIGALAGTAHDRLVAHRAAAEQQRKAGEPRRGAECGVERREVQRVPGFFDQGDAIQRRAGGEPHGDDVVAPIAALAGEGFDQPDAAVRAERNEAAGVQRRRNLAGRDMDDFDRLFQNDARRRLEDKAVGKEPRVQCGKGLIAVARQRFDRGLDGLRPRR